MAKLISNKIKLLLFLLGTFIGGVAFLYQKFFGGQIQYWPSRKFIGPTVLSEKKEEKVAVIKADRPDQGIREVISRTGNLDFIKPGQKVLVKPNVNSDDPAPGTTHPEAVAEVVRLIKERGAYVIVGDRSNPRWNTIVAMKKTGIYQAVQEAGADKIVGFEDEDWIRVRPEKAVNWPKGFRIPKLLTEINHIISVPVLHTHSLTSHSLAIKNLVGLIQVEDRLLFHASPKREAMIAEISLAIKPSLTVIDGTKAFIDRGPSIGTLANPKVYLSSQDILMAEVVGIGLLRKEGAKLFWDTPWESNQIKRAFELNLDGAKKEEIEKELKRII